MRFMNLLQVKMLLERFDKDGNGQLDVNEFAGFYAEAKAMYTSRVSLLNIYDIRVQILNFGGDQFEGISPVEGLKVVKSCSQGGISYSLVQTLVPGESRAVGVWGLCHQQKFRAAILNVSYNLIIIIIIKFAHSVKQ